MEEYTNSFHDINYFDKCDIQNGLIIPYEHNNEWYEIYHILSGDAVIFIDNKEFILEPNSVLLLPPMTLHQIRITSEKPYHRKVVFFRMDIIATERQYLFSETFREQSYYYFKSESSHFARFFEDLERCSLLAKEYQDMAAAVVVESMLTSFLQHISHSQQTLSTNKSSKTVNSILAYINEHLTENISLEHLASRFYMSKQHLGNLFHKTTGKTVREYIIFKRITLAHELIQQGESYAQASYHVGYQDYSSFYRAYKKLYGHAPSKE
ncbi:MAG: helix-turn-helix domain-containing protein [Lachnospiraceae bacterium]